MGEVEKKTGDDSLDWENRRLCPDESCIGIIGSDGRCTECGRRVDPADGPTAPAGNAAVAEPLGAGLPPQPAPAAAAAEAAAGAAAAEDDAWRSRRLCPDGNCIGVIGPDGRCKVCGRREDDTP